MSELPVGWAECSLQDLLGPLSDGRILHQGWSPQCESTPSRQGEWGVLKTTAVQDGYFLEEENKKLPIALSPKPELEVSAGDLLMTCAGPRSRCGVICHVSKARSKLIFSGKIYRFRPNAEHVEPKFLTHLLRTAELKEKIDEIKTGISESGMNMTRERFFSLPVRLAPFAEQTRIVQKLDEMLAQVDTLKARIDAIPVLLKRFRQSVIAEAVDGKLTELWRQDSGLSFEWPHIKFSELTEEFRGGASQKPSDLTAGTPVVRSSAVRSMAIDLSDVRHFDPETELKNRDFIQENDLLFTRLSGSAEFVGICALVKIPPKTPTQFPDRLFCARLKDKKIAKYLEIFFSSRPYLDYIRENLKSSAGHQRITTETVKNTPIRLPPIDEQTEIVRRVEQLFAVADQLETKVQNAKERIDKLTQSILAKAFRGELVPQDPNDEPASMLLERIQLQRAAEPKAKRGRKKAESA